jgi:malate dehydrogenase (oxaloacetate-decarboxylating)
MDETDVFAIEAADVAMQAIKEGVARTPMTWDQVHDRAMADILEARKTTEDLMKLGHIKTPPQSMIQEALDWAVAEARK